MIRQNPIDLVRLRTQISPVFQTENASLQIGCYLEPGRQSSRRVDTDKGPQIVLLLSVEENHSETVRSTHGLSYVRRIRQRHITVGQPEFVCRIGFYRPFHRWDALVSRRHVYQLEYVHFAFEHERKKKK